MGQVTNASFVDKRVPIEAVRFGLQGVCEKVVAGKPWEEAGQKHLLETVSKAGGALVPEDGEAFDAWFNKRYRALDRFLSEIMAYQKMRPRCEIEAPSFRERGGILVGLDSDGELLLFHGHHRYFLVAAAGLTKIPVGVFVVSRSALRSGAWQRWAAVHFLQGDSCASNPVG